MTASMTWYGRMQLETHKRYCYRKVGERPLPKPQSCQGHVWAGISKSGATEVCVFEGIN